MRCVEDVASAEVGIALLIIAHAVFLVGTGQVHQQHRQYACPVFAGMAVEEDAAFRGLRDVVEDITHGIGLLDHFPDIQLGNGQCQPLIGEIVCIYRLIAGKGDDAVIDPFNTLKPVRRCADLSP